MLPPILQAVRHKGYAVFTEGDYNLNIVGIRNSDGAPGTFDDLMCIAYRVGGNWECHFWPCTTDPGLYYLTSKAKQLNPKGTAILKEGQYRGVYAVGKHGQSQYEALTQQHGPVTVWRDRDHDDEIDYYVNPDSGWFGINIHAASMTPYKGDSAPRRVGAWSAGCQVIQHERHFREFMALVHRQIVEHPTWKKFTYTLIGSEDFNQAIYPM